MDIHLAWRAEGCACQGGEAFMGLAPLAQLRAVQAILPSAVVRPDIAKLVASYGEVLPIDAIIDDAGNGLSVVPVEGQSRDGFRSAMLTLALNGEEGDRYIEVLSGLLQKGGEKQQVGFVVVLGAGDGGAALLSKVTQARTMRMTEWPLIMRESPGRESARV